jgi:light-regulated signal transduction histidine kinase (bacteriophytochrome)
VTWQIVTAANSQQLISERAAELHVGNLPTVTGEPALIGELFQNLISNAVMYADAEHPRVEVTAERANGSWCISVEDNGEGVDPRHSERVFEMFKRLHNRDQSGAGIGLAICKRIVEKHGGRIWVEPREAGGSAFRFTVPAGPTET